MDPIGNKPYGFYGLSMVLQCHMNILNSYKCIDQL